MRNYNLDKNPAWIDGRSIYKKLAFNIYKIQKICFSCGTKIRLCVHHIDGNNHNNSKYNLQILCRRCHSYLHQEGRPHTEKTKRKLSILHTGKKLSKLSRLKISKAHKGRKCSIESRLKMSLAQTGHKVSKETRIKLAKSSKGNKNSVGAYRSLGHRKAVGEANRRRIWSKKSKNKSSKTHIKHYKKYGHHLKGTVLTEERKQKNRNWYSSLSKKEKTEYANKRRK